LSGNDAGSIPPWQGGIVTPPASYKPGDWHPDPFPEPENSQQAIWNKRLSYKGGGYRGYYIAALTARDGTYELGVSAHEIEYMYSDPRSTL